MSRSRSASFALAVLFVLFASTAAFAGPWRGTLDSIVLNPGDAGAGSTVVGYANLTAVAPTGGIVVALASSNTAFATVPASVTVPGGQSSASFEIQTAPGTVSQSSTITGTLGKTAKSSVLTLWPARPKLFMFTPNPQIGGQPGGLYLLNNGVTAEPIEFFITSSDPSVVQPPVSVTMPAGVNYYHFPEVCTTSTVPAETTVTITASYTYMYNPASISTTATLTP